MKLSTGNGCLAERGEDQDKGHEHPADDRTSAPDGHREQAAGRGFGQCPSGGPSPCLPATPQRRRSSPDLKGGSMNPDGTVSFWARCSNGSPAPRSGPPAPRHPVRIAPGRELPVIREGAFDQLPGQGSLVGAESRLSLPPDLNLVAADGPSEPANPWPAPSPTG